MLILNPLRFSSLWVQCDIPEWHHLLPWVPRRVPDSEGLRLAHHGSSGARSVYQLLSAADGSCERLHCRLVWELPKGTQAVRVELLPLSTCRPLARQIASVPWASCVDHGTDSRNKPQRYKEHILRNTFGFCYMVDLYDTSVYGWVDGYGYLCTYICVLGLNSGLCSC
jgi:hypothetical protein